MESSTKFQEELIKLKPILEKFALSLTANSEDAEELIQETLLKALAYQDKYQCDTSLKGWTLTIMKNTFINNYRKNIKHDSILDDSTKVDTIHAELTQKINQLEPEIHIPFQMHISGYKYKEISEKLNLKIGTVKSRIFFTRQLLKSLTKDENEIENES